MFCGLGAIMFFIMTVGALLPSRFAGHGAGFWILEAFILPTGIATFALPFAFLRYANHVDVAAMAISSNAIRSSHIWSGNRSLAPSRSVVSTTGAARAGSVYFGLPRGTGEVGTLSPKKTTGSRQSTGTRSSGNALGVVLTELVSEPVPGCTRSIYSALRSLLHPRRRESARCARRECHLLTPSSGPHHARGDRPHPFSV
jgi:hypothetical protein